ncbi:kelch domain-containing protein [Diaporthe helianthi]|uniref:Kelch domain-containing protein n=1 Tax=Diaporthe helianthi TaxID=158607 RepID=A0A2P5HP06_DIAHE|nr:kelch domain-containing protein [Diaporthe helianthi]
MISNIRKDRRSVFKEVGLAPEEAGAGAAHDLGINRHAVVDDKGEPGQAQRTTIHNPAEANTAAHRQVEDQQSDKTSDTHEKSGQPPAESLGRHRGGSHDMARSKNMSMQPASYKTPWYAKLAAAKRPRARTVGSSSPSTLHGLSAVSMVALVLAVLIPSTGRGRQDTVGVADAGPIVSSRADSPIDFCVRWAMQSTMLNGTLYMYGGEAKSNLDQEDDTWNNNLVALDLTSTWDTSSPLLTGLPQPGGPPAVALGALWNDYNSLYVYGGEFADNPFQEPADVSTWQYSISSSSWAEHSGPQTSSGNNSASEGVPVQRAAEGAAVSVPELGLSWYFGGHLDLSTTPGWSMHTERVYLKSLLEFTHPGYSNDGVFSLRGSGAPASGTYRNITQGGLQLSDTFTERADGVLVFVPGWGASGVLIGLGGGTAEDFADDMSTLDVYDIANSVWYHQQTTGHPPGVRVNPCAVIAAAPDASSFQVYVFGGQNLQPAGNQIQYDDMYILTIPSFTWIGPVSQGGPGLSIPYARAGHTCTLRDGQMIVAGGFNTTVSSCDSPGIYVFNASSLEWGTSFKALAPSSDAGSADNSVMAASYGYVVPEEVVSVVGGGPSGSATVTQPVASATGGPFATGKPPVFTITASGSTATITSPPGSSASADSRPANQGGLIAAIVVACLAGLAAGYLGYCAWLYRRQVSAYKTHLAVQNRFPARSASHGSFFFFGAFGRRKSNARDNNNHNKNKEEKAWLAGHRRGASITSSSAGQESFAWVGRDNLLNPNSNSNQNSNKFTPTSSGARPSYGDESKGGPSPGSGTSPGEISGSSRQRRDSTSGASTSSLEGLEPSFFSVVMGPRRALRVVNGLEDDVH